MTDDHERKRRWRLILGREAEDVTGGLDAQGLAQDQALGFLYDREYGTGRNTRTDERTGERTGGLGDSALTVPDWINAVHTLFPQKTIERLERDALERYQLEEMVTNPDVLEQVQPNPALMKAVLRTKHLMNDEVLAMARKLVADVVRDLMEKLAQEIESPFFGALNRQRRSLLKIAKNFDPAMTLRRNLAHYDRDERRLYIKTPYFSSRVRRHNEKWQIIILVDQSGSMLDSVIHASVVAAIFWGIRSLRAHLVIFDTNVVDLTHDCADPVATLMQVQLGGGTHIGQALSYAETLVEQPRQTIIVLLTDFYEGAPVPHLLGVTQRLCESGVHLLGLAALDQSANPSYNRHVAQQMANLGAQVGAMTPGELAVWVADKVR